MSSATRNPFALLNDDGDDVKPKEQAKPASAPAPSLSVKKDTPKEINAKQTTSKKRDPTRASAGEQRRQGDTGAARGGRGGKRSGPRNDNEAFAKDRSVGHDANAAKPVEGEAGATNGRGGARGGRGGRGARNGREFDRRNATGRTDNPKATEQAWGNEAESQQAADQAAATGEVSPKDPNAEEAAPAAETAAPVEEEDNTMSYEEYLKSKTSNLQLQAPKARAANEGQEDKWANSTAFEKDNDEAYFAGKQKQKSASQKDRKQKEFVAIEQRFSAPPVSRPEGGRGGERGERGGRGGRGRGEGRGRGGARGGASSRPQTSTKASSAPVMDESAFPELGKA
jgi:plasminogen activator inhibitor 1 RNA-binding protein